MGRDKKELEECRHHLGGRCVNVVRILEEEKTKECTDKFSKNEKCKHYSTLVPAIHAIAV